MTNTKMLEAAYTLVKTLDSDSQTMIDKITKDNIQWDFNTTETVIANMIIQLKQDIVSDEAKKNGKNNQLKAIKEIIKSASKLPTEALHYVKTIGNYQYACDDHILAKINSVGELKECPGNLEYLDVEKFFSRKNEACLELTVPDGIKLKTYIKDQTARHKKEKGYKILYNFGKDQPLVDAEMLNLAIDVMDGEFKAYYKDGETALYFEDKKGNEVLLMPVSKKNPSVGFIDETTKL